MTSTVSIPVLPSRIRSDVKLYPHQIEGVSFLARRQNWLLADEMGLGKTLVALIVAAIDADRKSTRICVVATASLKYNWVAEIERFTTFTYTVLAGTPDKRSSQIANFDSDILIINYEQIKAHLDELNALDFNIVIFDEAHYIKNATSKRTKFALKLLSDRYFLITGSPLLNRVNELWTLLHRIDPPAFPSYWRFRNRYCNTPDAPILMADGTLKPIADVKVGDQVMGWHVPETSKARYGVRHVETDSANVRRFMTPATVEGTLTRMADTIYEFTLEDGNTFKCTTDHLWLSSSGGNRTEEWVTAQPTRKGPRPGTKALSRVVSLPGEPTPEQQRAADWLSGVCDGEASWPFIAQYREANPEVWAQIGRALDTLEIPYTATDLGYTARGGRDTIVKMLNWGSISKPSKMVFKLITQLNRTKARVVSARALPPGPVVSMQTSTGNYIAWGLASKNCIYGGWQGKELIGVKNQKELHAALANYMLRRKKKDVLDLPEKQVVQVMVDLLPRQRRAYDEVWKEMQLTLPGDPDPMEIENALTRFLRLKQICSTTANVGLVDESAKLDRLEEMVEEIVKEAGESVVIFTQFRGTLAAVTERLTAMDVLATEISGSTPPSERVGIVEAWSQRTAAGQPSALVCMLQVAGVGLNMTAASKCIMTDKLFVPKLNEQAHDRLYRIGTDLTKPVQIFELIARKTIEQRIEAILRSKTALFDELIETPSWKRDFFKAVMEREED